MKVLARASPNIALIKYWGKRNSDLIIPINSSFSLTLDKDHINTTTSVTASPHLTATTLRINDQDVQFTSRMTAVLNALKAISTSPAKDWGLDIQSWNNFPTAAGMASSASGMACFTVAMSQVYGVQEEFEGQLSAIARLGSGSACRSIPGGFVEWVAGHSHQTSIAKTIFPASHWPNLEVFAFVMDQSKKQVSSSSGMSVLDSELQAERTRLVPGRLEQLKQGIAEKDFATVGAVTMEDSDHFHSIVERSGFTYLKDSSHAFRHAIHDFNASGIKAAYTFDAGPNPFVITQQEDAKDLLEFLMNRFTFPDFR
jgi:diphosphomevalonate decarboxylase